LEVARQLGRKGGRKHQMTDSKIESAKKLLANGGTSSGCGKESWDIGADLYTDGFRHYQVRSAFILYYS
jgi:hypothetical protein